MVKGRRHVAFFSQTGSEIVDLEKIGIESDLIICNQSSKLNMCEDLKTRPLFLYKLIIIPKKPDEEIYRRLLRKDDIITLHGYLNIIPKVICEEYEIYNGHPGLISLLHCSE